MCLATDAYLTAHPGVPSSILAQSHTFVEINHKTISRERSGRALDSRPKGRGFEPHRRHCFVSLSKNINPSLVLVQPRKIRPFITERLLIGRKESNQTNKTISIVISSLPLNHSSRVVVSYTMTIAVYLGREAAKTKKAKVCAQITG